MTVAEALQVLEDASTTRRARTAFEALHRELEATGGLNEEKDNESSSEPRWPDANTVADRDGSGEESAKGDGNSPSDGAKGPATARKGSS